MAFVPGFRHDLFVSYAQVDDISFSDASEGWVSVFVKDLRRLLQMKLGSSDACSIWMDRQQQGGNAFPPALIENVVNSAVLLVMLSPAYLASQWCLRENNAFLKSLAGNSKVHNRVLIVSLAETDRSTLPIELSRLVHFPFWRRDMTSAGPRLLGFPLRGNDDRDYFDGLAELAHVVVRVLIELRDTGATPGYVDKPETPGSASRSTPSNLPQEIAEGLEERRQKGDFDVFLCHNFEDKSVVKEIAQALLSRQVLPWLDEWELRPGLPWQDSLQLQIEQIRSAAVFVGSSGFGPWQNMELGAFLREFAARRCPVIPVILRDCTSPPKLPVLLAGNHWVDFRSPNPDPLDQLIYGITGKRPRLSAVNARTIQPPDEKG